MFMNCISCGKSPLELYSKSSYLNLPVYCCHNCDLYVSGNSKDELDNALKNFYEMESKNLRDDLEQFVKFNLENQHSKYLKKLWRSHYAYCKPFFQQSKNLLEIGPGTGITLQMLEKEGFSVTGIEPNEICVKYINQKLKNGFCKLGFIEDIPISEKYDVIWLSHCFEHMVRPDLVLRQCKHLLTKNGFIFIAVPDCENINTLNDSIHDNASAYHFSKKSLKKLAENAGLTVEKCNSMRELYRIEGRMYIMLNKYFFSINEKICPYYPFKTTTKNGHEIRIILKMN